MAEIEFGDVVLGRFGAKKRPFCVSVVARWNTKRGTRMDASPYYIRMRVPAWLFGSGASPVTKLYPAYGDNSYISTVHFLALLQTIPQLRSGTVLLQKRNEPHP